MPVDTQHSQYVAFLPRWQKWRDATAGEDAVKARREKYLPKLFEQEPDEYDDYLRRASYYNATGKTVDALAGSLFYHDASIVLPLDLEPLTKGGGRKGLTAQVKHAGRELVTVGRVGLLAEVDKEGLPRLYTYQAESILNWEIDDECNLVFVVLLEAKRQPKDEFEYETVPRYRVLQLVEGIYLQRVFEKRKDGAGKEALFEVDRFTPTYREGWPLDFIPFVFLDYESVEGEEGYSPIADLATTNLHHYMLTADMRHLLHLTACPILTIVGLGKTEQKATVRVGSSTVLYLNIGGSAVYTEVSGAGAAVIREELVRVEDQMSRLGVAALRAAKADAETSDSIKLQQKGESAVLTTVADVLTNGFTRIVKLFARWYGVDENEASVTASKEFFDIKISIPEAEFFFKLYLHGDLTLEDLLDTLQGGGVLQEEIYQRALERVRKAVNDEAKKDSDNGTGRSDSAVLPTGGGQVAA